MTEPPLLKAHIPLAGPLCLFLLGGLTGLLASYDLTLSIPWLLWLSAGAVVYIVIVSTAYSDASLRRAAGVTVIAASVAALMLTAQYRYLGFEAKFGVVARLGTIVSSMFPPIGGLAIQQNAAASLLEGALPLAIGLAIAFHRGWRLTWAACAVVIGWGVFLTGSRGAWLALAVSGMLGGLAALRLAMRPRARAMPIIAFVGAAAVAIALLGAARWQHALISAVYRADDRLTLYRNCLFLALDFPISGIGPGATFGMIYSHFQLLIPVFYLGYAHNLFLAIWLAQGLLGILGFAGLLLASGRLVWRGLLAGSGRPAQPIGWGAMLGCTAVLLHGLTDAPQYGDAWYSLPMIFALFGIMIAAARWADPRPLSWMQLSRTRWVTAGIVLTGIAIVFMRPLLSIASANYAAVLDARAALQPNLDDLERRAIHSVAIAWADRGLELDPNTQAARKERGMLALSLSEHDFYTAVVLLEPSFRRWPADQSIRKALGYAYIWQGRIDEGVALLTKLDRIGEIEGELQVWPYAWRDRGRPDLAAQAERAAVLMAALIKR